MRRGRPSTAWRSTTSSNAEVECVIGELTADSYGIDAVPLTDGDQVIDIGANFGAVAIYIAKRHPGVTVHAFEPVPITFDLLLRNIEVNNCSNIRARRKAVTGDGRPITLAARAYFLGGGHGPLRSAARGRTGLRALHRGVDDARRHLQCGSDRALRATQDRL